MAGAYVLAHALKRTAGRHEEAFAAYQARLKPEAERRQIEARKLASSFVPDSAWGIRKINLFLKLVYVPPFSTIFRRQVGARSFIK